jgi:hypothetical protein
MYIGREREQMTMTILAGNSFFFNFLLDTWKYVVVKIIEPYSVFYALSNGVGFIESARTKKISIQLICKYIMDETNA